MDQNCNWRPRIDWESIQLRRRYKVYTKTISLSRLKYLHLRTNICWTIKGSGNIGCMSSFRLKVLEANLCKLIMVPWEENGFDQTTEHNQETSVHLQHKCSKKRNNKAIARINLLNLHQDRFQSMQEFRNQYLAMKKVCDTLQLHFGRCKDDFWAVIKKKDMIISQRHI